MLGSGVRNIWFQERPGVQSNQLGKGEQVGWFPFWGSFPAQIYRRSPKNHPFSLGQGPPEAPFGLHVECGKFRVGGPEEKRAAGPAAGPTKAPLQGLHFRVPDLLAAASTLGSLPNPGFYERGGVLPSKSDETSPYQSTGVREYAGQQYCPHPQVFAERLGGK